MSLLQSLDSSSSTPSDTATDGPFNALGGASSVACPTQQRPPRVGIIGGGTAGSTIAIRLAELGAETYVFERKDSLIDGPPMCHLHAGGNLYREIPDEDCVALLAQCVDILRLYPYTIDVRPTVFAVPTRDQGSPQQLLPRLELLTDAYRELIAQDPDNKVLGEPEDYYQLYERHQLEALAQRSQVAVPSTLDEWMIPVAKYLDLDKVKYPLIVVQEYGWNIFRLAASATLALDNQPHVHVFTNTDVIQVMPLYHQASNSRLQTSEDSQGLATSAEQLQGWRIEYQASPSKSATDSGYHSLSMTTMDDSIDDPKLDNSNRYDNNSSHDNNAITSDNLSLPAETQTIDVDYLINACGFRTGVIDDMVGVDTQRMVEFKSSYVTYWEDCGGQIPEIIIYGERGTPNGMAQLTPYPDGFFQIHGMSKDITLFKDGLVASSEDSAQPKLPAKYVDYIDEGWDPFALKMRSQRAIDYVAEYIPSFASAITIGNALYGGQQIPGDDDTLRVADVSLYDGKRYARAENVKASSALLAADEIVATLINLKLLNEDTRANQQRHAHQWQYLRKANNSLIDRIAERLANERHFPMPMAKVNRAIPSVADTPRAISETDNS